MAPLQQKTQCHQNQQHKKLNRGQQQQSQHNNVVDGESSKSTTLKIQNIVENLCLTPSFYKPSQVVEKSLPPESLFFRQPLTQGSQRYKYTNSVETSTLRRHRNKSKSTNLNLKNKIGNKTTTESFYFKHTKWVSSSIWRLDSTLCIMLTMFFVATVVISGNAAHASQRDSYKIKDTKSINGNNVNAIPTGSLAVGLGIAYSDSSNSGESYNGDGDGDGDGDGSLVNANGDDTISIKTGTAASNRNIGTERSVVTGDTDAATSSTTNTLNHTTVTTATAVVRNSSASTTSAKSATSTGSSNTIASGNLQKPGSAGANIPNGNIGINRNVIEIMEDVRTGPYFDKAASRNVTALLGKTAYLNCRVKNLGNKTMLLQVSWVRHRDIHLLTVGRYTYTSDQRFRAIHQPQTEDWILQIKYPQHRDSGIYECQVSTTPHMSHYIHLNVVEPSTEIIGAPDLYIESGSTINLTCVILNSPEPPAYIFWNHNNAIINYDSPRGGVSVVTNKGETTTSFLLIKSARNSDSGLYQCNPSNAKPKSVTVHVLNGEFPAAMQRAIVGQHRMAQSHYLLVYLFMYLFTLVYVGRFMELSPQPVRLLQPTSQTVGIIQRKNSVDKVNTPFPICHYY